MNPQYFLIFLIIIQNEISFTKLRSRLKQNFKNEDKITSLEESKILQKFEDERMPDSKANCSNSPHREAEMKSEQDNKDTPPNPQGSINVDLDVVLDKIRDIDLNENKFFARGSMNIVWCDPRRKFERKLGLYRLLNDDVAVLALKKGMIWTPEIRFRNAMSKRESDNIIIYEFFDGTILQRENFTVELGGDFKLSKMPFDQQELVFDIGSLTWDADQIKILPEDQTVFFGENFSMVQFDRVSTEQQIVLYQNEEDQKPYSYLKAKFMIKRQIWLQIFKILTPICLLVFITSLIFLSENGNIHSRVDIFLSCTLSTVTQLIICEEQLPRNNFWNMLNTAILSAVSMMLYGSLISFFLNQLDSRGQQVAARKMADWMILYYNILQFLILCDLYIYQVLESSCGCLLSLTWTITGLAFMMQLCNESSLKEEIVEIPVSL